MSSSQASSSWGAFVKSIASFNGDLSSLTAPPFILSGTSLTEFSSYWCQHPNLFAAPASEPDPAERARLVLKWFISTLKQQYASRSEEYGNEKKPLNPFLGELFLGEWNDSEGVTELISEQVSHHPPATAYSIRNIRSGVHLEGYNAQKASFKSTIIVKQIGHAILTVPIPNVDPSSPVKTETFLITLPSLHIEGLLFGTPFVELDGSTYITSSSGFTARIDYSGKGWLSGKKNSVSAVLYRTADEKDILYNASGVWTKSTDFYRGPPRSNSSKTKIETYDAASDPISPLRIAPTEEQHPLESRRAWAKVAEAVLKSDLDTVAVEKGKIEQAQRDLRAKEREEGRVWERRYFTATEGPDPVLEALGPIIDVPTTGDADKTGGLWRFDAEKAEKVRSLPPLSEEEVRAMEAEILGQ